MFFRVTLRVAYGNSTLDNRCFSEGLPRHQSVPQYLMQPPLYYRVHPRSGGPP